MIIASGDVLTDKFNFNFIVNVRGTIITISTANPSTVEPNLVHPLLAGWCGWWSNAGLGHWTRRMSMRRAQRLPDFTDTQPRPAQADHQLGGHRKVAQNGTEEIQTHSRLVKYRKLTVCVTALIHFFRVVCVVCLVNFLTGRWATYPSSRRLRQGRLQIWPCCGQCERLTRLCNFSGIIILNPILADTLPRLPNCWHYPQTCFWTFQRR